MMQRLLLRRAVMVAVAALAISLIPVTPLCLGTAAAQDTACAHPVGSAQPPSFSPDQQGYRDRLHNLATGRGITVAIIDTGVFAHEQFSVLDAGPDFVTPDAPDSLHDCDIHGSVVASIIGARDMGIAPNARLVSIRQTSQHYRSAPGAESTGSLASMAQGIDAAVDAGARVISLSVVACLSPADAERLDSAELKAALQKAEQAGTVVVASAGNIDGDCEAGMVAYPGVEDTVITVAALTDAYTLADYSLPVTDGDWVSAPGTAQVAIHPNGEGWMRAAVKDGGEREFHGTSYATPTVSGTVALMLERNPRLSPQEVRSIVYSSAQSAHRVLDPLAALTHMPMQESTAQRHVAIEAPADADAGAQRRLNRMLIVSGAGLVFALFLGGVLSSWLQARDREKAALPPAATG